MMIKNINTSKKNKVNTQTISDRQVSFQRSSPSQSVKWFRSSCRRTLEHSRWHLRCSGQTTSHLLPHHSPASEPPVRTPSDNPHPPGQSHTPPGPEVFSALASQDPERVSCSVP